MFSVVKQGREVLKVHFMSHYFSESENTGAKLKHCSESWGMGAEGLSRVLFDL
jgi:hypothetical protein